MPTTTSGTSVLLAFQPSSMTPAQRALAAHTPLLRLVAFALGDQPSEFLQPNPTTRRCRGLGWDTLNLSRPPCDGSHSGDVTHGDE
jgi:hypothetical protein